MHCRRRRRCPGNTAPPENHYRPEIPLISYGVVISNLRIAFAVAVIDFVTVAVIVVVVVVAVLPLPHTGVRIGDRDPHSWFVSRCRRWLVVER